jgi:hypothetical protein
MYGRVLSKSRLCNPRSMELSSITDASCSWKRMSLGGWVGRKAGPKLRHHTHLFSSQPLPTSPLPQIHPKTLITPQHLRLIRYDADHHLGASIRQLRENAITSPSLTRISIPGFAVMNVIPDNLVPHDSGPVTCIRYPEPLPPASCCECRERHAIIQVL